MLDSTTYNSGDVTFLWKDKMLHIDYKDIKSKDLDFNKTNYNPKALPQIFL